MQDLHLSDAERPVGCADLHLERPAPVAVVHSQLQELAESDGPERWEVPEAMSEEQSDEREHEPVSQTSVREYRADMVTGTSPDSEHEIGLPAQHRVRERLDLVGPVGVVGVQEDQSLGHRGSVGQIGDTPKACRSIAALGLGDHRSPGSFGHLDRTIGRSVVDDDHERVRSLPNRSEDGGERQLLVERGNQNGQSPGLG